MCEFGYRPKGGEGGQNPCPNCLWQFISWYRPLLRHLIFFIFHQYLPWFPSGYHPRIMFDHSQCQNIHSQSQNCCFKNFLIFGKKFVPQSARICAIGGVKSQFGQCPNIHVFFLDGASLSRIRLIQLMSRTRITSYRRKSWVEHKLASDRTGNSRGKT